MKLVEDIFSDHDLAALAHRETYEKLLAQDSTYVQLQKNIENIGLEIMRRAVEGQNAEELHAELREFTACREQHVETLGLAPFLCRECRDTGYIDGRLCRCMRRRIYLDHYGAPDPLSFEPDLQTYDISVFDDRIPLEHYNKATARRLAGFGLRAAQEIVSRFPNEGRGLVIFGQPGTGKTYLGTAMAHAAAARGIDTLFIHAIRVNEIYYAKRMGQPVDPGYLESSGLLIIDDLGTEPATNNVTEQAFYTILERRAGLDLPTVFLTNVASLDIIYSERISSRLYDRSRYTYLPLAGEDLRSALKPKKGTRPKAGA